MCTTISAVPLGIGSERFPAGVHICFVFRDEAERRRLIARYVESGILEGERVYYFADTVHTDEVAQWMGSLDVDISGPLLSGSMTVDTARDAYCPDGTFVPQRMCAEVRNAWESADRAGYPNSRVTGEMSWALEDIPGADRLIEYEAAVNRVLETHPITAMCQYDANRFRGETIFQALQVHPYMIMGGQLVKNPCYEPDYLERFE